GAVLIVAVASGLIAWRRRQSSPIVPEPSSTTAPPLAGVGYFSTVNRALRGYGPLAVLLPLIVLMGILVPSKVPETELVGSDEALPELEEEFGGPLEAEENLVPADGAPTTTPGQTGGGEVADGG